MTDIERFFKDMALLGYQRAKRIAISEDWQDFILDWLAWEWENIKDGSFSDNMADADERFIREYARLANIDYNKAIQAGSDSPEDTFAREVLARATRSAGSIRKTTIDGVYLAPLTSETDEGMEIPYRILNGLPVATGAIVGLKKLFDADRAFLIATTEGNWICNHEEHWEKLESGQATHTWRTMEDEKVRNSHMEVDGQTVPIDEPFIIGGYRLYFPGDTSDNPPGDLVINCRCVEL